SLANATPRPAPTANDATTNATRRQAGTPAPPRRTGCRRERSDRHASRPPATPGCRAAADPGATRRSLPRSLPYSCDARYHSAMPSFDIVSELNPHEVANAIDQANREVSTRFDFKGTNAKFELKEFVVTLSAPADFQLKQMMDILKLKLTKRGIDIVCMKVD